MRLRFGSFLLSCAVLVAGCSGGGSSNSGGGTPPPAAPTVSSTTPSSDATGVAVNATVSATFSAAMNSSTLSASSFTLKDAGGTAVSGTVTYDSSSNTAKLTPAASLAYSTKYTATITTAATNTSGTALAANYSWSFTTAAAPAPVVSSTNPANNATNVAVSTTLTATFSIPMQASSLSTTTFTLKAAGGTAVTGAVSYDSGSSTATFTPSASLANSTAYTATISTGATSSSAIALAADYTWSFTTEAAPTPPTVTATIPANAATGVNVTHAITASFSQAMNASTINASTFTLTAAGGTAVAGTVTYSSSGSVATFTPNAPLSYSTAYTATITTGATNTSGLALASNYTWTFTTAAMANLATVDFNATKQTLRGFGASTAWMGALPSAKINALFGTGANQIGLSILRVRIDPYGTAGTNWVTTNWGEELTNAKGAIAANPNALIIASPWTPPQSMKTNNNTVMGSLDTSHYADYATYLEDYVTYFATNGVNVYGISMQNEPDATVTYESCQWTPAQMDTWVANNSSVLTAKLIMPESQNFLPSYSDPTLNDASAVNHVGIVAGHIYGVPPAYYANAVSKGKDVWQTEHYLNPAGAQPAIGDALQMAKEVHDSLVTAQYNAYLWWWAIDWNPGTGTTNDGLLDASGNLNYYGYAMAQFSRFIQPSYVRVNATDNPTPNVYVSAYSGSGHQVIVAINMGNAAASQAFAIQNASVTSLTPYQTTASGGVVQQTAVSVSGGAFTYTLPAQSITTFVQ